MRGLEEAFKNIEDGLLKYLWLQKNLLNTNISIDREYQRKFNHFYRVRRNSAWQGIYYSLLQNSKDIGIDFSEALIKIQNDTGMLEASFTSKLVATINPSKPVIDKFVLSNLGLQLPYPTASNREEKIIMIYDQVNDRMNRLIHSNYGIELLKTFDVYYPNTNITSMKKLDLILWQARDTNILKEF